LAFAIPGKAHVLFKSVTAAENSNSRVLNCMKDSERWGPPAIARSFRIDQLSRTKRTALLRNAVVA
jgi:hypothetical protein